ncbi:hypothetical protein UT300003_11950 [Clostridium sardiniense]
MERILGDDYLVNKEKVMIFHHLFYLKILLGLENILNMIKKYLHIMYWNI